MAELVAEHDAAEREIEERRRERRELRGATVRELASGVARLRSSARRARSRRRCSGLRLPAHGARHATPAWPGQQRGSDHARARRRGGSRRSRPPRWRRSCAASSAAGISARSVNKHREVLGAMFSYAYREDTYALQHNPVSGTSKRREMPAGRARLLRAGGDRGASARGVPRRPSGAAARRARRRRGRMAGVGGSPGRRALPRRRLHGHAPRRAARAALGGRRPRAAAA